MLIDRHRVAAVIALSRVPEAERAARQDALEALLVHLYQGATPAAREAFRKRMDPLPQSQKPWGALDRPNPAQWLGLGPPVPAVAVLLRGQQDDDPDSAEDGNRLPDRDSKEGAPWGSLYSALDRWDTATISRHIGPTGWQLPAVRPVPLDEGFGVEHVPAQATLTPTSNSQGPSSDAPATDNTPAPGDAPAPVPGNPSAPAPPAATVPLWRRPAVLGGVAVAGGLAVLYAFTRPSSTSSRPLPDTP